MEINFKVQINSHILYDYMMHHAYTSLQGLLGTTVGALLIVAFGMTLYPIYLIIGVVTILYIPWSLFLKSKRQALNPVFKQPLEYKMTEEGVQVSQGEQTEMQSWDSMHKAISTRNSIILYTTPFNACIFPRKDMKESTNNVIQMISTHMTPQKVKIRY